MSNRMDRGNISTLILAVLVLGALAYFLFYNNINWSQHFRNDSKDPYGTEVIYQLLQRDKATDTIIDVKADSLQNALKAYADDSGYNYVFIGNTPILLEEDEKFLLQWAEKGNTVFISSRYPPDIITDTLTKWICNPFNSDSNIFDRFIGNAESNDTVYLRLSHPGIGDTTTFLFRNFQRKGYDYYWTIIRQNCFKNKLRKNMVVAGTLDGDANFMIIRWGKGILILHTTPEAFSNYALTDSHKLVYAQHVMGHLNPSGKILWDEAHKVSLYQEGEKGALGSSHNGKSPLSVMLSQQSLRWAWYLLLATALLYIAWGSRRRQKVIPVKEPNTNTSLEFIRTIGQLYQTDNRDHQPIAREMAGQFYAFVRNRFGLKPEGETADFIAALSARTKYDHNKTKELVKAIEDIDREYWGDARSLFHFNDILEDFYQHCKPK